MDLHDCHWMTTNCSILIGLIMVVGPLIMPSKSPWILWYRTVMKHWKVLLLIEIPRQECIKCLIFSFLSRASLLRGRSKRITILMSSSSGEAWTCGLRLRYGAVLKTCCRAEGLESIHLHTAQAASTAPSAYMSTPCCVSLNISLNNSSSVPH